MYVNRDEGAPKIMGEKGSLPRNSSRPGVRSHTVASRPAYEWKGAEMIKMRRNNSTNLCACKIPTHLTYITCNASGIEKVNSSLKAGSVLLFQTFVSKKVRPGWGSLFALFALRKMLTDGLGCQTHHGSDFFWKKADKSSKITLLPSAATRKPLAFMTRTIRDPGRGRISFSRLRDRLPPYLGASAAWISMDSCGSWGRVPDEPRPLILVSFEAWALRPMSLLFKFSNLTTDEIFARPMECNLDHKKIFFFISSTKSFVFGLCWRSGSSVASTWVASWAWVSSSKTNI